MENRFRGWEICLRTPQLLRNSIVCLENIEINSGSLALMDFNWASTNYKRSRLIPGAIIRDQHRSFHKPHVINKAVKWAADTPRIKTNFMSNFAHLCNHCGADHSGCVGNCAGGEFFNFKLTSKWRALSAFPSFEKRPSHSICQSCQL